LRKWLFFFALAGIRCSLFKAEVHANDPGVGAKPQLLAKSFNHDGYADLVWENTTRGQCAIWLLNKGVPTGSFYLHTVPVTWRIVGVGDFSGDGNADLVWEYTVTGERAIWFLNHGSFVLSIYLPTVSTD
jgi:hypothetical protein